jgi:hypothetical protein
MPTTSRVRPKTTSAYLTASALSNAGFKGWPLVVMTALSGRESTWNPTALNNNPKTGDYSVGLFQINYFGDLLQSRTAEYGAPSTLLSNPQDQADAAYKMAGGNALTNLQPWALTASPANGVVPLGSTASIGKNTLAPYLPEAISAASEVGTFGPAPASQIAQASAWPGASPLGSALSSGGDTSGSSTAAAIISAATTSSGCSEKGNVFGEGGFLGIGSFSFTYCELKALVGGLTLAAGGVVIVIGMASLIVGSLGGKGGVSRAVGTASPLVATAKIAGRAAGAPRRRRAARTPKAEPTPEPTPESKPAPRKWEEFTPAQQAMFLKVREQKRAEAAKKAS